MKPLFVEETISPWIDWHICNPFSTILLRRCLYNPLMGHNNACTTPDCGSGTIKGTQVSAGSHDKAMNDALLCEAIRTTFIVSVLALYGSTIHIATL